LSWICEEYITSPLTLAANVAKYVHANKEGIVKVSQKSIISGRKYLILLQIYYQTNKVCLAWNFH
jgi:hypothetical protein